MAILLVSLTACAGRGNPDDKDLGSWEVETAAEHSVNPDETLSPEEMNRFRFMGYKVVLQFRDAENRPIPFANVLARPSAESLAPYVNVPQGVTDAQGRFIWNDPPREEHYVELDCGLADMQRFKIQFTQEMMDKTVLMTTKDVWNAEQAKWAGKQLTLRFLDERDNPVAGVAVQCTAMDQSNPAEIGITDAQGNLVWKDPERKGVRLAAQYQGKAYAWDIQLTQEDLDSGKTLYLLEDDIEE